MRVVPWIIAIVAVAVMGWRFPLFHVVPVQTAAAEAKAKTFDAAAIAGSFWTNRLVPALDKAVPAQELVAAIQSDPARAKTNYARSIGMDENYYYFLRGEGKVLSITDDEIALAITKDSTNGEVALETGLVFGDAVRDGTGLLNVNDYPDSQNFNDLSAALDQLVQTNVIPELRARARVGETVSFAGCAEVDDESTDLKPLKVIPIQTLTP